MKNKPVNHILFFGSLILMLTNLFIYRYFRLNLTPQLIDLPPIITNLGLVVIFSLFISGIYHLYLLFNFLKSITDESHPYHAYYLVFLILSGITLLSDAALLSDIGKEYLYWDVSGEWNLLFGFTGFHLLTMLIGYFLSLKTTPPSTSIIAVIKSAQDSWFLSLNKIGALCGVLGVAVFLSALFIPIQEQFRTALLMVLSILVIIPWGSFMLYWFFKNRSLKPKAWLDEKQTLDSASAAFITLLISMPLIGLSIFASASNLLVLATPFWLVLVFFTQLSIFSIILLRRSFIE